jgi:hypothetical protein
MGKVSRNVQPCFKTVILAIQETMIRRTSIQSQPRQIVHETLSQNTKHKIMYTHGSKCKNNKVKFKKHLPLSHFSSPMKK